MGWWPSLLGGKSDNPVDRLDPQLREFLDRESPVKNPEAQTHQRPGPVKPSTGNIQQQGIAATENTVPAASLYQDGRYAHLWKTYQPLAQIESENATEHDKLLGVLEGFKERKEAIASAAMENCAFHQEEWVNCMKNGLWSDQMQMCRHQVRRFEKCYDMQSRFLRALGYGSVRARPAEVDDDMQMYADSLWQRMLQHDAAVQRAKDEGLPIPVFDPVVPKVSAAATMPQPPKEVLSAWEQKLEKLSPDERPAEEAALRAEYLAKTAVAKTVKEMRDAERGERKARQAQGRGTIIDNINAVFGGGK